MSDDALAREDIKAKLRAEWTLGTDWAEIAIRHIEAARAEERERCAVICDGYKREGEWLAKEYAVETADELAARIRAGSPAPVAPVVWTDEVPMYPVQMFWRDVINELQRARAKFPVQDGVTTCLALTEEVGELARDVLQQRFESTKYRGYAELRKEAVQTAVMAIRVALDCALEAAGRKPTP